MSTSDEKNLSIDEIIDKKFNLTKEQYLQIDEVEFRARFRERLHHTLEIQTYSAIHYGNILPESQTSTAKKLVALWNERGLSQELPEYIFAQKLIGFAEASQRGEKVDLKEFEPYAVTKKDYEVYDKIIKERRSVRHWTQEKVPNSYIEKILESGLWAAHSCNLQSIRFIVVREENEPGLFDGSDIPGGPVHLVALQDLRVYKANPFNPERNQLIDVGAAVQNMVLTAHALGLGGVWLTFNNNMLERLTKRFNLPDYIKLRTYIDVGFPAQTPAAPKRLGLDEAIISQI